VKTGGDAREVVRKMLVGHRATTMLPPGGVQFKQGPSLTRGEGTAFFGGRGGCAAAAFEGGGPSQGGRKLRYEEGKKAEGDEIKKKIVPRKK